MIRRGEDGHIPRDDRRAPDGQHHAGRALARRPHDVDQSLLMAGGGVACSQLYEAMNTARDLCGGQICVTPDVAAFEAPETKPWLAKFYTLNEDWVAEDRRKLLAFARDLISSDYAGHRLAFRMFTQSPRFHQMAAVYRTFDWDGPIDFMKKSAGLSDGVRPEAMRPTSDGAVTRYFAEKAEAKRAAE